MTGGSAMGGRDAAAGPDDRGTTCGSTCPLDRVRASRLRPWACLAAAVAVVAVVCLVQTPKYAMPDDFVQDLYARGELFDTPGYLMLYSLVPFSAPLCALYQLLPAVPWYPLVLLAMIAVSFAVALDTGLEARLSPTVTGFLAVALVASEVMVTSYLTYTVVAFVACAAGLVLVMRRAAFTDPVRPRASDALAYALVIEGFSLRPESGIAAVAVFVPFLVWALARNRRLGTMLMAAGVVAAVAACYVAGQLAWHSTEGWETYEQTFHAAQAVADYPELSYDDIESLGLDLSENDLAMIYEFLFVDADVYSLEVFEALGEVVEGYGLQSLVETVTSRVSYSAFALGLDAVLCAVAWLLCASRRLRGGARALVWSVPAMTTLLLAYVFLRARPKMNVILPIFVVGLLALVAASLVPGDHEGRHMARPAQADGTAPTDRAGAGTAAARRRTVVVERVMPALGALAFVGIAAVLQVTYVASVQATLGAEATPAAQDYVDDNPDQLVLFTHTQGILTNYDIFEFESWEYPSNAVLIGGYEYYTAPWQTFLAQTGLSLDGFLLNLVDTDDMVTVGYEYQAQMIATYLSEHTGQEVEAQVVQSVGFGTQSDEELFVWRYVSVE